jgi:hypothetical protein
LRFFFDFLFFFEEPVFLAFSSFFWDLTELAAGWRFLATAGGQPGVGGSADFCWRLGWERSW